jgi:cytochrome P450
MADTAGLMELQPSAVRCPYPIFERLRREQPIAYVPEMDSYAVTRYDDILYITRHPELFSNVFSSGPMLARQMADAAVAFAESAPELSELIAHRVGRIKSPVLTNADPPIHTRQRRLLNTIFTPRQIQAWEGTIDGVATSLIDRFATRGTVELIREFAVPMPVQIIALLIGVPQDDMVKFKRWSDDSVAGIGNHMLDAERVGLMLRGQAAMYDYFSRELDRRRAEPRDDLITHLVNARHDGEELVLPEILAILTQIVVAGNETTTNLIGSAMYRLASDHDLAARLRADPDLVPNFVEESLRLDSPVNGLFRTAKVDCSVGDVEIPAGANLCLLWASANRDDTVFTDPDVCTLDRTSARSHLAFGFGPHFCLGAALARSEARVALTRLLERLDDITLDCPDDEVEYVESYLLHGLKRLPLRFTPSVDV